MNHEIQALLNRYLSAYRARDAEGCAACYAADGAVFSPFAPPTAGRDAIAALHRDWFAEPGGEKTLEITRWGGGDASCWCVARFGEGEAGGDGWSLHVMERVDGALVIRVSSLNVDA